MANLDTTTGLGDLRTDVRRYIDGEVAERARHDTAEEVRTTCSFARAERLLGREYHGRFLIELLQNAADAWRGDDRSSPSKRSKVAVIITDGPALLVANQGSEMTAKAVIESLGHIGASLKPKGEAIGHKGIGFKSVLEVSLAPEIYSGLQDEHPRLAVRFDPEAARRSIVEASPGWDDLVASIDGLDREDELTAVPILRFPEWVDVLPDEVAELKEAGFDSAVRLPFDARYAKRLRLDEGTWLSTVRNALHDVSDQIVLLLGSFCEVRIEDRLADTEVVVLPEWSSSTVEPDQPSCEEVLIRRNGTLSSRWRLHRQTMPASHDLAGEIAVGLRLGDNGGPATLLPATGEGTSAPFHLFFPTRIASGLPFLLHGYFEVDAARTGFYRGSVIRNRTILDALAGLTAHAISVVARDESIDLVSVVDLIAAAALPEEQLARDFREAVLAKLDRLAWLPLATDGVAPGRGRPNEILVCGPSLSRQVARVFLPGYVLARVQLGLPNPHLTDEALELIAARQGSAAADRWEVIGELCRPGSIAIWSDQAADAGFIALLDLIDALRVEDRDRTSSFLDKLRGDIASTLLPTPDLGGGRVLLPVPDPSEGVAGSRSRLVMARVRSMSGQIVPPPKELDLAFLPDGLLSSEADIDRAKPLGVRPFTVDNVLDRLNGMAESSVDCEALLRFLWHLLTRERASWFGTKRSAAQAVVFAPSQWYWCRPGRAREDDSSRLRQQRERYLAAVYLPCRDGQWRPAGEIAFGADWAEWIESGAAGSSSSAAALQRVVAYRAMESISPGPEALLAAPEVVLALLSDAAFDSPVVSAEGKEAEEKLDQVGRSAERHAFLLRLGVWEVPPIESFESRERTKGASFPWPGRIADQQQARVTEAGGWKFGLEGWVGKQHHDVLLAEDHRFTWSLEDAARRNAPALAVGLRFGAQLYSDRSNAQVFCPGCADSGTSHVAVRSSTSASGYPSWLSLQLQSERWLECTLDGSPVERPLAPEQAWWHGKPPAGAGLRQSPWRLLPLCGPANGLSEDLRRLARVRSIEGADVSVIRDLLAELRAQYVARTLPADPAASSSARQAFIGLHRLAYERLAELAVDGIEVGEVLAATGVLCELGDGLVYRLPAEARHDDGRFSTYTRHFISVVPFVVLPRDQDARATRLGVPTFVVGLERRGDDDGEDVTEDLRGLIGDRIPELLAIVVHHSLGSQTLELSSQQFEDRSRRLQALRVRKVRDLVIDASLEDDVHMVTLGEGSEQDIFLERPTSVGPILFHDLSGDGWTDRLRRKIAPHLATILENTAYAHTFALFLQAENDSEREEFLLELGISSDELDAVAARIGVVGEQEQQRHLRWFRAILCVLGADAPVLDLEPDRLTDTLIGGGMGQERARALVEAGGGDAARRDSSEGSPLRLLVESGVDLAVLDAELRSGGDPGLVVSVSRTSFARWIDAHGRQVAAVIARRAGAKMAKSSVRALVAPPTLSLTLEPAWHELLAPVVQLLTASGWDVNESLLAGDPAHELARVGAFASVERLDAAVALLYNEEEQRRMLRERAAQWRVEIRLLAVLGKMGPAETRASVRAIDDEVGAIIPGSPAAPSELTDAAAELFAGNVELGDQLAERLVDSLSAPAPDRHELLAVAEKLGMAVERLVALERALQAPRRDRARALKIRSDHLQRARIGPRPPVGLVAAPVKVLPGAPGPKPVVAMKIGDGHDRRKRELGDEGEKWALASVVGNLLQLSAVQRDHAIDEVAALLQGFKGLPVEAAAAHIELARSRGLDEEELIDELTGLLHVAEHSDAFGFDLIGWLPPASGLEPQAMCVEVKSSGAEGFNLSTGEWSLAQKLHDEGRGTRYAVLIVRRGKRGGLPTRMDLLVDPVALLSDGKLRREVDGYRIDYRSDGGKSKAPELLPASTPSSVSTGS